MSSFSDARTLLVDQLPDVGEKVVVFAWSAPIPNDGFAVAGDLPQDLKDDITAALLDIASTPQGVETLSIYDIDGLAPVNPANFDVIRELRTKLANLLRVTVGSRHTPRDMGRAGMSNIPARPASGAA